jgi:NRPS condensation-like uncharacterized protein
MYTREASALDLFTDSVRIMGDATPCAVMEFDRKLDAAVLEEASQACLLAHPILHSQLVRGNGPAFWKMAMPARVPPLKVIRCDGNYHPHVIGPVDPYKPLQFRVRLLRRPAGDIIVVNLAHAAADAFGLNTLCTQLLTEYGAPGSILPVLGGIPERDTLWTRKLAQEIGSRPSAVKQINPMWPDPFGTSEAPSSFHRDIVDPETLLELKIRTRALGGSINDAMMAAYFLSMSDLTGHRGPVAMFFPVNLRQHLNNGSRVMSNQATNACFTLEWKEKDGIKEVLSRVIKETTALKAGRIGVAEQVEMDRICDPEGWRIHEMVEEMAAMQKAGMADIFISNPGMITLPDIEGLNEAYFCYPGGYMPTTCFATSTFRGQLTITMGYQESDRARTGTRKAMDLFRQHLLSLIDGC